MNEERELHTKVEKCLEEIGIKDVNSYLLDDLQIADVDFHTVIDMKTPQVIACNLLKNRGKQWVLENDTDCNTNNTIQFTRQPPFRIISALGLPDGVRDDLYDVISPLIKSYSNWQLFEIAIEYAVGAHPTICTTCHLTLDNECTCEIQGKDKFPYKS